MKTTILLLTLLCASAFSSRAQNFYLTFNEPTNAAVLAYAHYDEWTQPVNSTNPTSWNWAGQVPAGTTNIDIPNGLPNPIVIALTATDSNANTSAYSAPLTFDTNAWLTLPPGRIAIHKRH